jgi:hypothetical protein
MCATVRTGSHLDINTLSYRISVMLAAPHIQPCQLPVSPPAALNKLASVPNTRASRGVKSEHGAGIRPPTGVRC